MVEEIRIYIEGDTKRKGKYSDISLREGFNGFFQELIQKARDKRIKFRPILSGSKAETYKDFLRGLNSHPNSFVAFLIDSDKPVNKKPKLFLKEQEECKNWDFKDFEDEQCHLMVQVMESWFLADVEILKDFYGQNFKENKISKNTNVEKIVKQTVENSLREATKDTQKGEYHKTKHGAKLLQLISPKKVCESAPHCKELFRVISEKIS